MDAHVIFGGGNLFGFQGLLLFNCLVFKALELEEGKCSITVGNEDRGFHNDLERMKHIM